MRIVFFGYGELGALVLGGLLDRHEVLSVVTHRSGFTNIDEPDTERLADKAGVPVLISAAAREPELHAELTALQPEVVVSTNWRTRIPPEVLRIPGTGAINVHDALLPAYAGFGAVNWAIRNGESRTGLTVHFMDDQLDTGPVVTQTVVPIEPQDTAADVLNRLLANYVPVALAGLDLVAGGFRGEPQDPAGASFYHRIGIEDTGIDWRDSATVVLDLVRGQSDPFINAWTIHDGRRLWVRSACRPQRTHGGTPGRVVRTDNDGVVVACGGPSHGADRGVVLQEVAGEDGVPVQAVDYFTRFGERLG
jgi:methionyl-tRNA formyltransferase